MEIPVINPQNYVLVTPTFDSAVPSALRQTRAARIRRQGILSVVVVEALAWKVPPRRWFDRFIKRSWKLTGFQVVYRGDELWKSMAEATIEPGGSPIVIEAGALYIQG